MMKNIMAAGTVVMVGMAGLVFAQANHPPQKTNGKGTAVTKNTAPLAPENRARDTERHRLTDTAWLALNAGDFTEAESDARQSLTLGGDANFTLEILASALYSQGRDQEALHVYQQIADTGDSFPRNLLPYALLLLKAGYWKEAVWAYNKALPHLDWGELMRQQGGFSPDVPQPTELEAAIHIGMGLTGMGGDFHGAYKERYQQGLVHFQKALALEKNSALTNYYYGYGLQRLRREADAQAAFRKAAALDHKGDVKAAAEKALSGR